MTIRLLEGIQLAGVHQAVGSVLTLTPDAEARHVSLNRAVYTTLPDIGDDAVPVLATKNVTGKSEILDPATGLPMVLGGAAQKTSVAMHRMWGMGSTFSSGGTNNNIGCKVGKETLESEICAVRVWVFSKEYINESSGWEVIVAPTDQLLNDSVANAFYPQVGGTQYNLMAESSADKTLPANQYGWRRAQWGGQFNDGRASKSGRLRPASNFRNQSTLTGYYPVTSCIKSDWIDIKTVPASDGKHYMLWRAKKAAVAGETQAFTSDKNPLWKNASSFPWYRRQFVMGHSADAIGTLTNVPAAPTEANFQWSPCTIAFEYRYKVAVRSVAACGDSITENGGNQSYSLNNWIIQACGELSTAAAPVIPVNLGFSTTTYANFFGQLEQMFAQGFRPTDVILPNVSFNDFSEYGSSTSGTEFLLSQVQARLMRSIEICRRYGAKVYVTTDFHNLLLNSATAAYNQLHADIYAFTLALGTSGVCTVIDWRANWNVALDDGVHAYQAGIDLQASLVKAALSS